MPAKKQLVYYGGDFGGFYGAPMMDRDMSPGSNTAVDVWLKFRNDKDSGMGMPLPAGRIRVSQQDKADGSLEFIGEDTIKHTQGTRTCFELGTALDVVGDAADGFTELEGRVMEEAFEIRSATTDAAVEVIGAEPYR